MSKSLSVIMTNYNHAKYIGEALEAILSQSYIPMEVIVIDDASTDNSIEIIDEFVKQYPIVKLIKNEQNRGVLYNVQKLLHLAQGEYIYAAASDDKILPGFFDKTMNLLTRYPQAGLCCSDPATISGNTGIVSENQFQLFDVPCYLSGTELIDIFRQTNFGIASYASIIKRDALLDAGGFIPNLKWNCDWFAMLVIAFRNGICYIPEPLATIRLLNISYSAAGRRKRREHSQVLKNIFDHLNRPEYSDVLPFFIRSGILSSLGLKGLRVIISRSEYRLFLSPFFLYKALSKSILTAIYLVTPLPIKKVYRYIGRLKVRKLRGASCKTI